MTGLLRKNATLVVGVSVLGMAAVYFGLLYLIAH
jgi:hypothetical protein